MSRLKLLNIVFGFALINAMIRPIREHITGFGFFESLLAGFGISFIVWFAIYCSFDLLLKCADEAATQNDWKMAFITVTLLLVPSASVSWIALSFFAIYCGVFVFCRGTAGRNASFIMLAIALRVPVSDICLKLSADVLLQFDAAATLSFLSLIDPAVIRQGNIIIGSGGHELLIMTGCASFTNISLALLLWFTIVRMHILRWRSVLTLAVIPLVVFVMGINIARLSMMTLSQEKYFFYHDGFGADIVNALIVLSALGFSLVCISAENCKKREVAHAT